MLTVVDVELLAEALPLMALPAVVLPETLTLPVVEDWALLLVTAMQLLLTLFTLALLLNCTQLLELGPVKLMLAVSLLGVGTQAPEPLFTTFNAVLVVLLVAALPLLAEPAVVLWLTLAAPLPAHCALLLPTTPELVLTRV